MQAWASVCEVADVLLGSGSWMMFHVCCACLLDKSGHLIRLGPDECVGEMMLVQQLHQSPDYESFLTARGFSTYLRQVLQHNWSSSPQYETLMLGHDTSCCNDCSTPVGFDCWV